MAEGTEAPYKPNSWGGRPPALPDEMKGSPIFKQLPNGQRILTGHVVIRPNDPAPPSEPVKDMRPDRLLEDAGFESAEDWGNSILSRKTEEFQRKT